MISYSPAKINIGLKILDKRTDGYHNLSSYFYPVPFFDIIEIQENNIDELVQTGFVSTQNMEDNLVYKSLLKLRKNHPIPNLKIHLHKQIPFQAGLGGGSSNAVTFIKMLNSKFQLGISDIELLEIALGLGSDCPFFVKACPSEISGRGEIIKEVNLSLSGKYITIVKPELSISTSKAFASIAKKDNKKLASISIENLADWNDLFTNDFQLVFEKQFSEIKEIKNKFIEAGAVYVSLSGSGSAVYGIFNERKKIEFNSSYFLWTGKLQ